MAWRDEKIALKAEVHQTFQYAATLHHPTLGDVSGINVRWHREGDVVGTDDLQILLDAHEIVFDLEELSSKDVVLASEMEITIIDEGRFHLMESMPANTGYQRWTAGPVA